MIAIGAIATASRRCSGARRRGRLLARPPAPSAPPSAAPPSARRERRRAAPSGASAAGKPYKIGYSNAGGVGNGFREEQVCTAKAEALASGQVVASSTVIHRNTDAAGQLPGPPRPDRRRTSNAIVFNPNDPDALNPALAEAQGGRHQDRLGRRLRHRPEHLQPLQQPGQVRRARRQVAVRAARRQGHRLVHARHRRPPGRHRPRHRLQERPQGLPGHQGRPERRRRRHRLGSGRPPPSSPTTSSRAATTTTIQGIWTSGMDSQVVDAIKAAEQAVRADRRRGPRRASSTSCSTRPTTRASRARP